MLLAKSETDGWQKTGRECRNEQHLRSALQEAGFVSSWNRAEAILKPTGTLSFFIILCFLFLLESVRCER